MGYAVGLIVALSALWLGLSGLYDKPIVLSLGAVSIVVCLIIVMRMKILDRESSLYHRLPNFFMLAPWLLWEIIKSNIVVIRACLAPRLDINPALVNIPTRCGSDLARVTFANSITLTPGTVTIGVGEEMLIVHALYEELAQPEAFIEMDRRCAKAADWGHRAEPVTSEPATKPAAPVATGKAGRTITT